MANDFQMIDLLAFRRQVFVDANTGEILGAVDYENMQSLMPEAIKEEQSSDQVTRVCSREEIAAQTYIIQIARSEAQLFPNEFGEPKMSVMPPTSAECRDASQSTTGAIICLVPQAESNPVISIPDIAIEGANQVFIDPIASTEISILPGHGIDLGSINSPDLSGMEARSSLPEISRASSSDHAHASADAPSYNGYASAYDERFSGRRDIAQGSLISAKNYYRNNAANEPQSIIANPVFIDVLPFGAVSGRGHDPEKTVLKDPEKIIVTTLGVVGQRREEQSIQVVYERVYGKKADEKAANLRRAKREDTELAVQNNSASSKKERSSIASDTNVAHDPSDPLAVAEATARYGGPAIGIVISPRDSTASYVASIENADKKVVAKTSLSDSHDSEGNEPNHQESSEENPQEANA